MDVVEIESMSGAELLDRVRGDPYDALYLVDHTGTRALRRAA
jgi:hypothetical protein